MDYTTFKSSLDTNTQPQGVSIALMALWHDARGDWEKAHTLVQDEETGDGAWIHAYLHRKEGDIWNADYWYRKARRIRPNVSLESEWEAIVKELLVVED